MSDTSPNPDGTDRILPPGKSRPEELVAFIKNRVYRNSRLYFLDYRKWRKAELYDQSCQWLRPGYSTSDAAYPMQWEPQSYNPDDPNAIPLPVYNEGVLLRENESARLGRPEYKPRVKAKTENPDLQEKEGALGAERALQSRVREMWSSQEDLFTLHPPLYGGVWIESRWDQTWLDTVRVPAPSLCCPRHPNSGVPQEQQVPPLLSPQIVGSLPDDLPIQAGPDVTGGGMEAGAAGEASPPLAPAPYIPPPVPCAYVRKKVPAEMGQQSARPFDGSSSLDTQPHEDGGMCPNCQLALVDYQPTINEALNSKPGADVGIDQPKGDWFMTVRPPYQIFPRDAGIGLDPTDLDEWVYVHVETLAWAEQRWPDKIRDIKTGMLRVHPENAATLLVHDPTLGVASLLASVQHLGVLREHVVVYEYHRKPWLEWDPEAKRYQKNRGRSVVVVGNEPCLDDALMVQSLNDPKQWVPRVRLEYVPWEYLDGGRRATVGQSLWDRLFDAQDGINERMSQVRAVNQRGALPWYLQQRGMNFETKAADAAVPFRRVLADFEGNSQQLPLQIMNNTTIDAGVYQELQITLQYVAKQVVEVERGQVPPGVSAATAIAYLKTESGEKRRPRIKRLRDALVRAWDHGVKYMASFYIEPRPYIYEDEGGEERFAFIHGSVIAAAKPKVDIYPAPDYDVQDLRRETIRDMIQLRVLNPAQTPALNRKIVKAMDESLDFFVDDDLQEEQAQREWQKFKDQQYTPVVDPSLDDHEAHYRDHGEKCFSEWFRSYEDQGEWDQALQVLGGDWEESLKNLAMQVANPMLANPFPAPGMPPGAPQLPPGPPQVPGAPPAMPGMAPVAPTPAGSLQDQIIKLWAQKLMLAGIQPKPALVTVLKWRAHMEAHKMVIEVRQMKQALAAPPAGVAAPGSGSSPTSPAEAQAGQV